MMLRFATVSVFLVLAWVAPQVIAQEAVSASSRDGAVSLQPGDLLRVTIWREEDLSGEFPVNEDGVVTLPLLGEKRVTGMPLATLRATLAEEYRVQLLNPAIEITPLRRVHVLGEVNRPGLYEVDPTISMAGVVAIAGGPSSIGDLNRIRVVRGSEVFRNRVAAETALATADIRSGDQIFVERRGWFDRNSTFVVSALLSVTTILITLLR